MQKDFAAWEAAMLQGEQEQTAEKARLAALEKKLQVWAFLQLSSFPTNVLYLFRLNILLFVSFSFSLLNSVLSCVSPNNFNSFSFNFFSF